MIPLQFKQLHPAAKLPEYATDGSGCFDLAAVDTPAAPYPTAVAPGQPINFRTGLAVEIPEGHVMLIFSRSGHGFNKDVRLANCVGVIDADYRGEIRVKLTADAAHGFGVMPGDRIAQALVLPVPRCSFAWAADLSETERGEGGFGSTGQAGLTDDDAVDAEPPAGLQTDPPEAA